MKTYIDSLSKIVNSQYGKSFKAYSGSEVLDCIVGDCVTVGNDCIVKNSSLLGYNSVNRRNFLLRSVIGKYTYTGINTLIKEAEIGNFCSISWGVSIGGGNHDMDKATTFTRERFHVLSQNSNKETLQEATEERLKKLSKCIIGHDVWISAHVVINNGIKIGNGAVIGAGAIVTKDVEPYSIEVGVPAKKIKKRFDDKTIEALQEIQWWNWPIEAINKYQDLIYSRTLNKKVIEQLKEIKENII